MDGSSASLKSRSKPRDWSVEKKRECDDLRDRSSSRTRMRRSVGLSMEKENARNGRTEIRFRPKRKIARDFGPAIVRFVRA